MTELITFHHPKHGDIYVVESTELCSPYFIADQVIKLVGPLEGDADPDEFIHTDVWHQVPEFVQLYAEGLCYSNNFKFPNKLISGLCFLRLCKNSVNKVTFNYSTIQSSKMCAISSTKTIIHGSLVKI